MEQASKYIEEALERYSDNPYTVDLWVQIETHKRDSATAYEALSRLEMIDKPMRYNHRLSTVELAFGKPTQALEAAQRAAESESSPPFEILLQLALCQIEVDHLPEAEETLEKIAQRFGNTRRDAQVGLRCQLIIKRGEYKEALLQMERIENKNRSFYKRIRRDALRGEIQTSVLKDAVRAEYEDEITRLNTELASD